MIEQHRRIAMSDERERQDEYSSINADRTAPYPDHDVEQQNEATYGATEEAMANRDTEIAPTFSDMEPGAGLNYGAAGDPDAPNLGGLEDRTTLGEEEIRPPSTRLTGGADDQGQSGSAQTRNDMPSYGRSPEKGLGGAQPSDPAHADQASSQQGGPSQAAHQQTASDPRQSAQSEVTPGQSGPGSSGDRGDSGAGMLNQERGEHMAGVGPAGGAPGRGDTPDAVAARNKYQTAAPSAPGVSNTGVNKIDDKNKAYPGLADNGAVTYGRPEIYQGDGDVGRFGATSGGAGELAGGHLNDLFDQEPARDALTQPGAGAAQPPLSDDEDLNPQRSRFTWNRHPDG
jgi:hypothetical protein